MSFIIFLSLHSTAILPNKAMLRSLIILDLTITLMFLKWTFFNLHWNPAPSIACLLQIPETFPPSREWSRTSDSCYRKKKKKKLLKHVITLKIGGMNGFCKNSTAELILQGFRSWPSMKLEFLFIQYTQRLRGKRCDKIHIGLS